jgi:hypothetical protein
MPTTKVPFPLTYSRSLVSAELSLLAELLSLLSLLPLLELEQAVRAKHRHRARSMARKLFFFIRWFLHLYLILVVLYH